MIYNYLVEMGFDLIGQNCPKCKTAPLVRRGEWIGCWECLTSGEMARRGRSLLERIKTQQALEAERERRKHDPGNDPPFWPKGMPL